MDEVQFNLIRPNSDLSLKLDANPALLKSTKPPHHQPTPNACLSPTTAVHCLFTLATFALMAWGVFSFRDYLYYVLVWVEHQQPLVICLMLVALFMVVSLPFTWGYILLNLACGYIFGILAGIVTVICTASLGVCLAHLCVKHCCTQSIAAKVMTSDTFRAYINVISGPQAFKVVLFARLTPIPFGLQNAVFAFSALSLGQYLAATALGLLPTQIINVYLGSTLRSMQDVLTDETTATTGYVVFAIQIVISIAVMAYVVRRARKELQVLMMQEAKNNNLLYSKDVENGKSQLSATNGFIV